MPTESRDSDPREAMRGELLRLLRQAWEHGGADAIAYAEERSTRSLGQMEDLAADELWDVWLQEHEDEIDQLAAAP